MAKKLLLVEDDELLREVIEKVFTESGYVIDSAINGVSAMQKVRTNRYDLVLLDVILPDISGIEILRNIRNPDSLLRNTPVFITSNLPQDSTMKDAEELKFQGYLSKTSNSPQEMAQKVTEFFAKQTAAVEV